MRTAVSASMRRQSRIEGLLLSSWFIRTIRGLKEGLTEEERYAVADHAAAQLKGTWRSVAVNEETANGRAAVNVKMLRF